jgi:hypothetical protein
MLISDVTAYRSFRDIPPGMSTNETWMLHRRKALPGAQPVAYFRPEDFVPEPFGSQCGIPLYRFDQTRDYHPRPETVAAQQFYDFFVASQNRHKYGLWDDGWRKRGRPVKPYWLTLEKYLSRAKIRDHLRGKDIYGCWGNLWTTWFALDVDYHVGDPALFLEVLRILNELEAFLPQVRWVYALNRNAITGLHLIGLLPEPRLLEDVHRDLRKVLAYLEDEQTDRLQQYRPAKMTEEDFHPIANLEIYPATNHNFRLPYAADRITITDEGLNYPGQVDLKGNLVKFMEYVRDPSRRAIPLARVIDHIQSHVRMTPPQSKKATRSGQRQKKKSSGNGMGRVEPLKGRHLEFLTGVVLGTESMPADTIGCWATPALRHLMLVDGLGSQEALAKLEEFYEAIPDPSFSDRLSKGNLHELLRTDAYTAAKIEEGNLYQPRPEESAEKFARVKDYCQRIGFAFADPSTWNVLQNRRQCPFDITDVDFCLTFEEKLAIKETGAALLKCDIPSVYQAGHCVKAFITKYPGRELPARLVPQLCAGLPISWHIPSDAGTRCKKAEKFLALLCRLGVIKVVQPKEWHGPGHPANRAFRYGLPTDQSSSELARRWFSQTNTRFLGEDEQRGEGKEKSIYIRDFAPFTDQDLEEFYLEVERLNRPWKPQYHSSG